MGLGLPEHAVSGCLPLLGGGSVTAYLTTAAQQYQHSGSSRLQGFVVGEQEAAVLHTDAVSKL